MRPIKAHELNHSGAMARLMQRRGGVFDAQDNRSRLVQRFPRQVGGKVAVDHKVRRFCPARTDRQDNQYQ